MSKTKKAVVLVSGGLDSATVLAMAKSRGFACYALAVDYGQRHRSELDAAARVAEVNGAELKVLPLDLRAIGGSALTADIDVPEEETAGIPITYVPARNTIMLSLALACSAFLFSYDIFIVFNAVVYSCYPYFLPSFIPSYPHISLLSTLPFLFFCQFTFHPPLISFCHSYFFLPPT